MAVSWEERRYRCAWVALGPRVDDGDGCAGTCGDVFPHLQRQKSYNHQHFISLFIHTHVCSSHLTTTIHSSSFKHGRSTSGHLSKCRVELAVVWMSRACLFDCPCSVHSSVSEPFTHNFNPDLKLSLTLILTSTKTTYKQVSERL